MSPSPGKLPRSVLVVEDDAFLGLALEQELILAGIEQVIVTPSTEEAMAALRENIPEALVLDVHLADRSDGWAIAELVRTLGPDGPRIVFSTGAPEAIPEDVATLGEVLAKPYSPDLLIEALRRPKRRGMLSRLRSAIR